MTALSLVMLTEPRHLAVPGFKGGPAPHASEVLAIFWLSRNGRRNSFSSDNDNERRVA